MNLIEHFMDEFMSDDAVIEKESDRIVDCYQAAVPASKNDIDTIFISLCGYSLETLIAQSG